MKIIDPSFENYRKSEDEIMVFLGGTCSDKKNWRNSVVKFLEKIEEDKVLSLNSLTIVNPFISKWSPTEEELQKQIEWESSMIGQSDIYACYLDASTEAPISLFEIGRALFEYKTKFANNRLNYRVIVSAHPDYPKLSDIKFEIAAATSSWKTSITDVNVDKGVSGLSSKILEAYMKFSK